MARVPEEEIGRLKEQVSLVSLAEAAGVTLRKTGADLTGCCPFHEDGSPSLVISPAKNLWHCLGACQAGGSVIDWVMRAEGVSFRHAVELLRDGMPVTGISGAGPKRSTVRKLASPVDRTAADDELLGQVVDYYHRVLRESPGALGYLQRRKIGHPEAIEEFRLGYADRTLGLRLPDKRRRDGAEIRGRLEALGIFRASGHEHLAGSLVSAGSGFYTDPWRYMLDYVVDPRGNAIAYFYDTQVNYYAEDNGTTGTGAYVQGGTLAKIEYGLRAGAVYGSTPAAQVTFTLSDSVRADAPTDLACAQGAACPVTSPTFWTSYALASITTQALAGGSLQDVDSWALADSYPATGDSTTPPSLWLSSVTRTGQDGTTPVTLPPTSFAGTPMPNRVETAADSTAGYSLMTRFRLTSITNETGGVTTVAYSSPDAGACAVTGNFPAPNANTASCYPAYWYSAPGTQTEDWFNLYSAASVTDQDSTGGDPPVVTSFGYAGAAWHYDNDTVSRSATVTWDQWRGFASVTTQRGMTSPWGQIGPRSWLAFLSAALALCPALLFPSGRLVVAYP